MQWLYLVSYFFGGVFLANALPHFVSGTMGRSFENPFAKPGFSSPTAACGLGALLLSLHLARHCGRFHGGNSPEHS